MKSTGTTDVTIKVLYATQIDSSVASSDLSLWSLPLYSFCPKVHMGLKVMRSKTSASQGLVLAYFCLYINAAVSISFYWEFFCRFVYTFSIKVIRPKSNSDYWSWLFAADIFNIFF